MELVMYLRDIFKYINISDNIVDFLNDDTLRILIYNNGISERVQIKLFEMGNDRDLTLLAGNTGISKSVQILLYNKADHGINYYLVKNHNLCDELQRKFRVSDRCSWYLAKNPNISIETQLYLANSEDLSVKIRLAGNPCICRDVQVILRNLGYIDVISELACNPGLCVSI